MESGGTHEEDEALEEEEDAYVNLPSKEDGVGGNWDDDDEERPKLGEGLYEIEAVHRKRAIKGEVQYLVKWWKSVASQPPAKKRQQHHSLRAATHSALGVMALTRENSYNTSPIVDFANEEVNVGVNFFADIPDEALIDGLEEATKESELQLKISDLKVSAAMNEEDICAKYSQLPKQGGIANDTLLYGRCIGAKRRKSGAVKRFRLGMSSTTKEDMQEVSAPNGPSGMATIEAVLNGNSGKTESSKTIHITEILKLVSYTSTTINNTKDVLVTFTLKRADGKEVMVDNKFLKANHPALLINFYEQHLRYTTT